MRKLFTKPYILLIMVFFIGVSAITASSQYSADIAPNKVKKLPLKYGKLDPTLNDLVKMAEETKKPQLSLFVTNNTTLDKPKTDPKPPVMLFLSDKKETDNMVKFLKDNQSEIIFYDEDHGYIEAYVPVLALVPASSKSSVGIVRIITPPKKYVVSEGVAAHGATKWHTDLGVTGAGVKVGVIDAGFEDIQTLMGSELPASIEAWCAFVSGGEYSTSSNISDCENGEVHGTAVSEAVFDVASGTALYIASIKTSGEVRQAVDWMIAEGVDIINMSLGFPWQGPGDGTSPNEYSLLNTVDRAVAAGIVWFSAAGNDNQRTWYGNFTDSDGDGLHEWEDDTEASASYIDNSEINSIYISSSDCIDVQLRWEDNWPNASTDLDIGLLNTNGTLVNAIAGVQDGSATSTPHELKCLSVATSGVHYIIVDHYSGETPNWIQLNSWKRSFGYTTNSGSITNPAESANPSLMAVGAARWSSVNQVENFSSRGPTPDGRIKPDIVGADGGQSASNGVWGGTSQASPHLAGLAALVLEQNPDLSPTEVIKYLKDCALPRESKIPNNTWGHGFGYLPSCHHAWLP